MKTSFSLKGGRKRILERKPDEEDVNVVMAREIKSFDAAEPPSASTAKEEEEDKLVIPLPPSLAEKCAVDTNSSSNMDVTDAEEGETAVQDMKKKNEKEKKKPLLLANLDPRLLEASGDHDRFKLDMSLRAADVEATEENYKAVPVEKFGAALLRGMGWTGPTKEDEEWAKNMDNFVPRDAMLGLGAVAKPPDQRGKKTDKGKAKHEKWEEQASRKIAGQTLQVGDAVWLRDKAHAGLRGIVRQTQGVPGLSRVRVALENSGETVDIPKTDAVLIPSSELELKPINTSKIDALAAEQQVAEHAAKRRRLAEQTNPSTSRDSNGKAAWCLAGIRVRIVSKKIEGAYLSKGRVVKTEGDVVCVHLDGSGGAGGRELTGVKPKYLETIVPKPGGRVLVLTGSHRGREGIVEERFKDKEVVS